MQDLKIGILELGYRGESDSLTAIQGIMDYAVEAEKLGYERFWLAEHHSPNILQPFSNPEILISIIAGITDTIRVGSAGTMVKIYNPYCTVTNFKLLNNLFADRIDLGLSKGNPDTSYSRGLFEAEDVSLFERVISEIHNLLYNEEENYKIHEVVIPPFGGSRPELWYLSSSYTHFPTAVKFGFNYCRSLFHGAGITNSDCEVELLFKFRSDFSARHGFEPQVSLALAIEIFESDEIISSSSLHRDGEGFNILKVTINHLCDLIQQYRELYGVSEFILYDVEGDNTKKIENISRIADNLKLKNRYEKII